MILARPGSITLPLPMSVCTETLNVPYTPSPVDRTVMSAEEWSRLRRGLTPPSAVQRVTHMTSIHVDATKTRMRANAQRDGRPAEHRWRPLFNAAKFGWCPVLDCHAVTLPRRESCWNWLGCSKLPDRSQPLVDRSSLYCGDIWRTYCCLISSFPTVDTCLSCEDIAWQICKMVRRWQIFGDFLHPAFSASRVQYVSDLHPKFALRPHHVWKYGRYPVSDRWG